MSRKESKNEVRSRASKKSQDRILIEFEDGIKKIIDRYQIIRKSPSKQAEDDLVQLIDKTVMKYYE